MSQNGPSVLHITYDLIRGGTEGQCARVCMCLNSRGLAHRVAVFRRKGFFLESVEQACGPVYEIGITRMLSLDTFRRVKALAGYMRSEGFDLVHGWDMDACIFGYIAARWAGVPFITSRRNMADVMPEYKKRLLRFADRHAAHVVVNADSIRAYVEASGVPSASVTRIGNIVDVAEFDRLASLEVDGMPSSDNPVVGIVGRLEPEKDVATLLRAAAILRDESPVHVVIVGSGSLRSELEQLAEELGISQVTTFLGERSDVPSVVRHFDIGVLVPASNEGLSNSILEYMAAGKPVVATDCGGNRELIERGNCGFIVPVGDANALANSIRCIITDDRLASELGANGRSFVEREHGQKVVVDQFATLYEEVAKRTISHEPFH
ncbi:MAG: glycosyltransferase [Verrucomicrobia bacterium]|nr:glycosyltransferase [Verrucomicrobiota bacterium]